MYLPLLLLFIVFPGLWLCLCFYFEKLNKQHYENSDPHTKALLDAKKREERRKIYIIRR